MTEDERRTALDAIAGEVAVCTRCRLHENRTKAVPGEGHPDTEVAFVGEGPGFNEDRQGRPFVGRAGDLLEKLLASVGWNRQEVFIANVVKCRPPDNRDPQPDEIAACSAFLTRQLAVLDPALVVTLGRFSMGRFSPGARIGQVHGTFQPAPTGLGADRALVYFMYHPAAALRDPSIEATSFRDMAGVPAALLEARRRRVAASAAAERAIVQPNATPAASAIAEREAEPQAEPGADVADDAIHSVASGLERESADPSDQLGLF